MFSVARVSPTTAPVGGAARSERGRHVGRVGDSDKEENAKWQARRHWGFEHVLVKRATVKKVQPPEMKPSPVVRHIHPPSVPTYQVASHPCRPTSTPVKYSAQTIPPIKGKYLPQAQSPRESRRKRRDQPWSLTSWRKGEGRQWVAEVQSNFKSITPSPRGFQRARDKNIVDEDVIAVATTMPSSSHKPESSLEHKEGMRQTLALTLVSLAEEERGEDVISQVRSTKQKFQAATRAAMFLSTLSRKTETTEYPHLSSLLESHSQGSGRRLRGIIDAVRQTTSVSRERASSAASSGSAGSAGSRGSRDSVHHRVRKHWRFLANDQGKLIHRTKRYQPASPHWQKVSKLLSLVLAVFPEDRTYNERAREEMEWMAQHGFIKKNVDADDKNVPMWKRADSFFYTDDALDTRQSHRKNALLLESIRKFWNLLTKTESGDLPKSEYMRLNRTFYKAMIPEWDAVDAEANAESDWNNDAAGKDFMDIVDFEDSMFEVVDMWCPSLDIHKYLQFLNHLFKGVTVGTPTVLRELKDVEYIPDLGDSQSVVGDDDQGHDLDALQLFELAERILAQWHSNYDSIRKRQDQPEGLDSLRRLFNMFDLNRDGFIELCELRTVLKGMKLYPPQQRLEEIFDAVDVNGDHFIDFDEFVSMRWGSLPVEFNIICEFKKYDVDPTYRGYLTKEGISRVLKAEKYSDDALEYAVDLFMKADTDRDGKISFKDIYEKMSERISDAWLEWVHENLDKGVSPEILVHGLHRFGEYRLEVCKRCVNAMKNEKFWNQPIYADRSGKFLYHYYRN